MKNAKRVAAARWALLLALPACAAAQHQEPSPMNAAATTETRTDNPLLAEEIRTLAFTGSPAQPVWLDDDSAAMLLDAKPAGNMPASLVKGQLKHLLDGLPQLQSGIEQTAARRAEELAHAHSRVRKSAHIGGAVKVEPVLPADILGCFILLPANA